MSNKALVEELMSAFIDDDRKFWDDNICKDYLVDFCPSEEFKNTKIARHLRQPCKKEHNDRLKKKYQESNKDDYPYERDFYRHLKDILRTFGRLRDQRKAGSKNDDDTEAEREEAIARTEAEMNDCLKKSEEAGEEGRVKESDEWAEKATQLQEQLNGLKNNEISFDSKSKATCKCGGELTANQSTGDETIRISQHMGGKQHTYYVKIENAVKEWEKTHGQKGNRPAPRSDYNRPRHGYRDQRNGGRDNNYRRRSRDRRENDDDWGRDYDRYDKDRHHDRRSSSRRSRSRSPGHRRRR